MSRPFIDIRVGGLRLILQRRPRWMFVMPGFIIGTLTSVLTLRR